MPAAAERQPDLGDRVAALVPLRDVSKQLIRRSQDALPDDRRMRRPREQAAKLRGQPIEAGLLVEAVARAAVARRRRTGPGPAPAHPPANAKRGASPSYRRGGMAPLCGTADIPVPGSTASGGRHAAAAHRGRDSVRSPQRHFSTRLRWLVRHGALPGGCRSLLVRLLGTRDAANTHHGSPAPATPNGSCGSPRLAALDPHSATSWSALIVLLGHPN